MLMTKDLISLSLTELKKRQVKILVVAVGSYISGIDEMAKIASNPP